MHTCETGIVQNIYKYIIKFEKYDTTYKMWKILHTKWWLKSKNNIILYKNKYFDIILDHKRGREERLWNVVRVNVLSLEIWYSQNEILWEC